ncbi:MAG: hypothetical protein L6R38_009083 [Xanthoria sp. 2 TBL-2021]|nr:MAG: hypothetical protein L6R38_009083 [Xanthoria sp. 2 TBL-2021]
MGLKDRLKQGLQLSQCMTIEFADGFNPKSHLCLPGSRLTGHVVIRNPKVLEVEVIPVTISGISDAFIHRKISGIRAGLYGRGFLYQEFKDLTGSPVKLEPNLESGHHLPFESTMPSNTMPMAENTKNFINNWQTKECFAGAHDMHALPPPFSSRTKALLGYTDSSISPASMLPAPKPKVVHPGFLKRPRHFISHPPGRNIIQSHGCRPLKPNIKQSQHKL